MDLAEARFRKRITQWRLAKRTKISATKISLIENGYIVPREEEKERLANALELQPEEIQWPTEKD